MTIIIVSSCLVTKHRNGGEAWVPLSWVEGLRQLGYDAYFVEQLPSASCVDAQGRPATFATSDNVAHFRQIASTFGLEGKMALIAGDSRNVIGMEFEELRNLAADAALLVNISGHLRHPEIRSQVKLSAYVDQDPGYTQFWYESGNAAFINGHDHYLTLAENIGLPGCSLPTGDIDWIAMRQPVVMDAWPVAPTEEVDRFTTVSSWRGPYGPLTIDGLTYGLKVHEFRKVIQLPQLVDAHMEIALDIHPADDADLASLRHHGWTIVDPRTAAGDPMSFQRYVQGSGAEFSVAQGVYVGTRSGWISDRTVRYLASGKPALVQDTGSRIPTGQGLITFKTLDEAEWGVETILRDYTCHAHAARDLAERHFNSDLILGEVMERLGIAP